MDDKNAPALVGSDPYMLIGKIPRFGFKTVDTVARKMGVKSTDPQRLYAGVAFCIDRISQNGNTWTTREALLDERIVWTTDVDFGYQVVDVDAPANAALLEQVPVEILSPRRLFAAQGRTDEYAAWVTAMKSGRTVFLRSHDVDDDIVAAVECRAISPISTGSAPRLGA